MDPNRLYSYFIELDWLFLIAYSLFIAGVLIFASGLWPSSSKSEESQPVVMG